MTQFNEMGQEDGPAPVLPNTSMRLSALPVICQPSALPGPFAAMESHTRHIEGVRLKIHMEDVSSYVCLSALSTSI